MLILLIAFLISSLMVAYMLPHILILSLRKRLVDPIDPRKIHSVPASRLGGVTFLPAIIFSSLLCMSVATLFVPGFAQFVKINVDVVLEILALLLLFLVGVYDDVIGVSYKRKFLVQIFASILIVMSGTYFSTLHGVFGVDSVSLYISIPISILFFVFVINAINLIDGIDGLASLLSIMALFVYGILLYNNMLIVDSLIVVATLGALVPFCFTNVFGVKRGASSKIFMGDTGSMVIGAVLAFSAVKIWNLSSSMNVGVEIGNLQYILAYTMLFIPCLDVLRIILHRYRAKSALFKPDKNHFHHKLIAMNMSARRALMTIICVNLFFVLINIAMSFALNIIYIFIVDVVVWIVMHLLLTRRINSK